MSAAMLVIACLCPLWIFAISGLVRLRLRLRLQDRLTLLVFAVLRGLVLLL